MKNVVSSKVGTESRGVMRNGVLASASVWQIWVLTLDCAHVVKRPHNGFGTPPKRVKCNRCDPKPKASR
jgi:hypothetical protein